MTDFARHLKPWEPDLKGTIWGYECGDFWRFYLTQMGWEVRYRDVALVTVGTSFKDALRWAKDNWRRVEREYA